MNRGEPLIHIGGYFGAVGIDFNSGFPWADRGEMNVKVSIIEQWLAILKINLRFAKWCPFASKVRIVFFSGFRKRTIRKPIAFLSPAQKFVSYELERPRMNAF